MPNNTPSQPPPYGFTCLINGIAPGFGKSNSSACSITPAAQRWNANVGFDTFHGICYKHSLRWRSHLENAQDLSAVSKLWIAPAWKCNARNSLSWVGPSGCGKSDAAHGRRARKSPAAAFPSTVNASTMCRRRIATSRWSFKTTHCIALMTVYQNMAFGLMLRKYPKAK